MRPALLMADIGRAGIEKALHACADVLLTRRRHTADMAIPQPRATQGQAPALATHASVSDLAGRVSRTLGVARALALSGRRLDLSGIEDGVGLLCAQTLDLPGDDARRMVPVLREVLARVNALYAALQEAWEAGFGPVP
jgi:hypothetical protein